MPRFTYIWSRFYPSPSGERLKKQSEDSIPSFTPGGQLDDDRLILRLTTVNAFPSCFSSFFPLSLPILFLLVSLLFSPFPFHFHSPPFPSLFVFVFVLFFLSFSFVPFSPVFPFPFFPFFPLSFPPPPPPAWRCAGLLSTGWAHRLYCKSSGVAVNFLPFAPG